MRIYFIRHSETDCNKNHLFYGRMDVPINENGNVQAALLADHLKHVKFDRVYASNLLRVRQTLDIVLKNNEYAVEKLPEIIFSSKIQEMDFGLWEGKNYREISEEYPEDVDRWANDWENSRPTGGESFKDFCTVRIKNAFFEIVEDALAHHMDNGTILIAAHNGVLQAMFAAMMGLGMYGMWHFQFEQDAYCVVDFECDNYTVRRINSRENV